MSSKHIEDRRKVKEIPSINTFNDLLEQSTLSEDDKKMLRLHYLEDKDFRYIGDMLGFSESTIKYRHKRAIKKLSALF